MIPKDEYILFIRHNPGPRRNKQEITDRVPQKRLFVRLTCIKRRRAAGSFFASAADAPSAVLFFVDKFLFDLFLRVSGASVSDQISHDGNVCSITWAARWKTLFTFLPHI